jgi:hypothetical protein
MFHVFALLYLRKVLMSRGAPTWFETLGAMVWKLLIIEPFFQSKFNKIKIESNLGIWKCSWCFWKALGKLDY